MSLTTVQPGMLGTPQPYNFKNRAINGACAIDQKSAGASVTPGSGETRTIDNWSAVQSSGSINTVQQNAGSVTPPAGFTYYLGMTMTSAVSPVTGSYYHLTTKFEGLNVGDLGWGTANAKTITLSFWVRASVTGTYSASVNNASSDYCYVFNYSISSANTWTKITQTIAGPTTGTFPTTNTRSFQIRFSYGTGSTYSTSTVGSWQSGDYYASTSQTNLVSTNGATFYITGVQFEVGSSATDFDVRSYQNELAMCQRYFVKQKTNAVIWMNSIEQLGSGYSRVAIFFPVFMRTVPTISNLSFANNGAWSSAGSQGVTESCFTAYINGMTNSNYVEYWNASAEL